MASLNWKQVKILVWHLFDTLGKCYPQVVNRNTSLFTVTMVTHFRLLCKHSIQSARHTQQFLNILLLFPAFIQHWAIMVLTYPGVHYFLFVSPVSPFTRSDLLAFRNHSWQSCLMSIDLTVSVSYLALLYNVGSLFDTLAQHSANAGWNILASNVCQNIM